MMTPSTATRWTACLLLLIACAVYRISPVGMLTDSNYSMLLSEQVWRHGSLRLDEVFQQKRRAWPADTSPGATSLPYHIYHHAGHLYAFFPPATPLLSTPLVAVENFRGLSAKDRKAGYNPLAELLIERDLAAFLTAVAVALLFLLARRHAGFGPALFIAVAAALGSSLWSSTSRVMWSHVWGGILLTTALLQAGTIRREARWSAARAVFFASLLAWLYFTRPAFGPAIASLWFLLAWKDRRAALVAAGAGLGWLGLFLAYGHATSGALLPPYYRQHALLDPAQLLQGLAGVLLSPSRGLFVFMPLTLVALVVAAGNFRRLSDRPLAVAALAACAGQILMVAAYPGWWGGHCYGPRLLSDLIPWFVVLGAMGWTAGARHAKAHVVRAAGLAALLLASIALHAIGACSWQTVAWLVSPAVKEDWTRACWDWRHPQFAFWQSSPAGPAGR